MIKRSIKIIDQAFELVNKHINEVNVNDLSNQKYERVAIECPYTNFEVHSFFAETKNKMTEVVVELADMFYKLDIVLDLEHDDFEKVFKYLEAKVPEKYLFTDIFENIYDWLELFLKLAEVEFDMLETKKVYI